METEIGTRFWVVFDATTNTTYKVYYLYLWIKTGLSYSLFCIIETIPFDGVLQERYQH